MWEKKKLTKKNLKIVKQKKKITKKKLGQKGFWVTLPENKNANRKSSVEMLSPKKWIKPIL